MAHEDAGGRAGQSEQQSHSSAGVRDWSCPVHRERGEVAVESLEPKGTKASLCFTLLLVPLLLLSSLSPLAGKEGALG